MKGRQHGREGSLAHINHSRAVHQRALAQQLPNPTAAYLLQWQAAMTVGAVCACRQRLAYAPRLVPAYLYTQQTNNSNCVSWSGLGSLSGAWSIGCCRWYPAARQCSCSEGSVGEDVPPGSCAFLERASAVPAAARRGSDCLRACQRTEECRECVPPHCKQPVPYGLTLSDQLLVLCFEASTIAYCVPAAAVRVFATYHCCLGEVPATQLQ